jgi:hypothetical protein
VPDGTQLLKVKGAPKAGVMSNLVFAGSEATNPAVPEKRNKLLYALFAKNSGALPIGKLTTLYVVGMTKRLMKTFYKNNILIHFYYYCSKNNQFSLKYT